MTTQQIEYVIMLAEEKSFSSAAKKLYITQPSLSQFIMNLENQIGLQLFDRNSYPIKITPAGEIYIKNAKKILDIEKELNDEITDLLNMKTGNLVIGATSFRAACLLNQSIAAFHKKYDKIKVEIIEAFEQKLGSLVQKGDIDFYIGTGHPDLKLFHYEILATERIYLAVPENNPINNKLRKFALSENDIITGNLRFSEIPVIDIKTVADEPFILLSHDDGLAGTVERICENSEFNPLTYTTVKHMETVFSFINSGIGLGFVPDSFIKYGNSRKHPVYYALDESVSCNDIVLVSRKNKYFTKASVEYIRMLKQMIGFGTWL